MRRVAMLGVLWMLGGCAGEPSMEAEEALGSGGIGHSATGGMGTGGQGAGQTGGVGAPGSGGAGSGGVGSGGASPVEGTGGATGGADISTGGETGAFPSVDGQWAEPGPFQVTEIQGGPDHTVYYPTELGRDGVRHPVIIWGNGTGVTPVAYAALLRHWASHGFIVAAANTTWAGSGAEMLAGATWLIDESGRPDSPFFGNVAVTKIGAAGHSQGGGGAIAAGADPVVVTTVPIQPGPQGQVAALHGPMFILGGANDTIVNPDLLVEPRYQQATHIEAIYGLLAGASHFVPAGNAGAMRGYITAWFRLHLMGDESARAEFYGPSCGLCSDPEWTVQRNYE